MAICLQERGFEEPSNPETKLWRYMDFSKFVSMLENKGLYFSRADKLGDPFEGSYPQGNKILRKGYRPFIIPEDFEIMGKRGLKGYFVNCWHMNDHESAAMWNLYTKSNEAVSIQSKYDLLKKSLDDSFFISMIKYINYMNESIPDGNAAIPFIYKRKSFEHEREIRAFTYASNHIPNIKSGKDLDNLTILEIWQNIDLNELIEGVYLSPTATDSFKERVKDAMNKYGLNKPVIRSSLDDAPFF